MQYMVTGVDGKEYGPTDFATLKTWASENRLAPHTILRDFNSGQTMAASALPGLFPATGSSMTPPVAADYPRGDMRYASAPAKDPGSGMLVNVILRSIAAVVFFFVLKGIGVIVAAYAMFYAVRCYQSGSKYGVAALAIAGVALLVVAVGWGLRLSGAGV